MNEDNNEEIDLMSIDKKYIYYKNKYLELKTQNEKLIEDNKNLLENLKNERNLRKKLEEDAKYHNISNKSLISLGKGSELISSKNTISINEDDLDFDDNEDLFIKNNNKDELNNNNININMNKINNFEIINNVNDIEHKNNNIEKIENIEKNDNNNIEGDEFNELGGGNNNNIILDNKNNNNDINNNEIINEKKDDNIILDINNNDKANEKEDKDLTEEESLSKGFIIYGKDSINLRNNIYRTDLKINKIYNFLKKMRSNLESLKKGVEYFNKSITLFNDNLIKFNNTNTFKEFPFVLEQISIIQKCFSTMNIYCSSLTTTIDSSCSFQINNIIANDIHKLLKLRISMNNEKNDFSANQYKFLNTKKRKKENKALKEKEKYYTEYKNFENKKYNYYSMLNKCILNIKLKIPEIISLLTYSYITFFTNIHNELEQTNILVRQNLENIVNQVKIRKKIEKDMDTNKNIIIDQVFNNINAIKNKEGFLYTKDDNKIAKRYVKISDGNLIYYKLNKVIPNDNPKKFKYVNLIDNIDTSNSYEICNLLLSNVKKADNNSSYPFCFEINTNTRKSYTFQCDTEYDMEEWVASITNAISEQIIGFDGNNTKIQNSTKKNNENINDKNNDSKKDLPNLNQKNKIEKLINENICADCGAQKPTWLSLNWLTMICIDCSATHRSLGVQISKIRSLELDNIKDDYIELLSIIKQNDINGILEEKIKEYENEKPKFNSSREEKEQFIINKYKNKKYMNREINIDENKIIKDIFESIERNDLLNIYKLVKSNMIDINKLYKNENDEYYFIQYCLKLDKISCYKLFCSMDADINLLDNPTGNKS